MGKKQRQFMVRQGDVLIFSTDKGVDGMQKIEREEGLVILARGEATGHHHSISSQHCDLYMDTTSRLSETDAATMIARMGGGLIPDRLLEVREPSLLRHQEHKGIKLPPGNYTVRIQREYSPTELRNVAD